jgi:Putative prokaryotic signal transducing protein
VKEVLTTNDPVRLSFLRSVLEDAGVKTVVLDNALASVLSSLFTSRLMVDEADLAQAKRIIADAERSLGDGAH